MLTVDAVRNPRLPDSQMLFLNADHVNRLAVSIRELYGTLLYGFISPVTVTVLHSSANDA